LGQGEPPANGWQPRQLCARCGALCCDTHVRRTAWGRHAAAFCMAWADGGNSTAGSGVATVGPRHCTCTHKHTPHLGHSALDGHIPCAGSLPSPSFVRLADADAGAAKHPATLAAHALGVWSAARIQHAHRVGAWSLCARACAALLGCGSNGRRVRSPREMSAVCVHCGRGWDRERTGRRCCPHAQRCCARRQHAACYLELSQARRLVASVCRATRPAYSRAPGSTEGGVFIGMRSERRSHRACHALCKCGGGLGAGVTTARCVRRCCWCEAKATGVALLHECLCQS
jgi:hypothetical protein